MKVLLKFFQEVGSKVRNKATLMIYLDVKRS